MSWKLARKDMSLLIRNPITYLGIIFMIVNCNRKAEKN